MPYKLGDGELFRSLLQHKLRPMHQGWSGRQTAVGQGFVSASNVASSTEEGCQGDLQP